MRERITHYALAVWTAAIVLVVVGHSSPTVLILGTIAGIFYLVEVTNGLQGIRTGSSQG